MEVPLYGNGLFQGTGVAADVSEELAEIIREEIRQTGPVCFARWMDLCLYHPKFGYYTKPGRKTGPGRSDDFVTPPTLHPFIAQAVGMEIQESWVRQGRPSKFRVLEWGGGEGDMANRALAWMEQNAPDLAQAVSWAHAERNPGHGVQTGQQDPRITWLPLNLEEGHRLTPSKAWTDAGADFVLACEFLDALPVDVTQWVSTKDWCREVFVDVVDDGFAETIPEAIVVNGHRMPNRKAAPYQFMPPNQPPDPGHRFEYGTGILWWCEVGVPRQTATVLVIDYGDRTERLISNPQGSLRGFRKHAMVDDVLSSPGDIDLTASVDFSKLVYHLGDARRMLRCPEMAESSFETLEQFLLRHGILDELNRIDRNTVEGASSYLRLRQLLLPSGMGAAFKVQRFDRVASGTA